MSSKDTRIAVLGDGGWGTALTLLLAGKGYPVTLWGHFAPYVEEMRKSRENRKFLPGFCIPEPVRLTSDMREALASAEIVVLAAPSQYMRSILKRAAGADTRGRIFVSVAKGIETKTLQVMSQVVQEELGRVKLCVLSGPAIAKEVAMKMPAAVSLASRDKKILAQVRALFTTDTFSVFESEDVLGVELGGSIKNVIAISSGIVEGLGFGTNTQAALFARGVAEMARLGAAMGAHRQTFMGLSGLGDLATTCLSRHSRNRWLGEEIGKGRSLKQILGGTEMVVEGVETCRSAHRLAKKHKVSMPIVEAVYGILFGGRDPRDTVKALMKPRTFRELD